MNSAKSRVVLCVAAALIAAGALGQVGSHVPNWTVAGAGEVGKTTDVAPPRAFIGVVPCRIVDTRGPAGPYGAPSLPPSTPRTFDLNNGPCAGLPASVNGYSLNVTVTNTQGAGFILVNPTGGPVALVSSLNYVAGQTIANAVIVPAGAGGAINVTAGVSGTDLIIDINGYFAAIPDNQANTFEVVNSGGPGVAAILGTTNSAATNATGVRGLAAASTGITVGVWGQTDSSTTNATGVYGVASSTSPAPFTFGVWGRTQNESGGGAGVFGEATGFANGVVGRGYTGVRGEATGSYGVYGISPNGMSGVLGYGTTYGIYATVGTIGCNACVKQFVDPHPTDPSKTIHYGSLEGPEAGTYFRGTARAVRGQAVIEVPDHFRWVTQEEGMTVQLTPLGDLAMMAVVSKDLNRIVVRSSKDVAFDFLVHGIRPAFRDFQPVQDGDEYRLHSPTDKMPKGWTAWTRQRLVENGTYNPDGTVNMETAERLGWTTSWTAKEPEPGASPGRGPGRPKD